MALKFGYGQSDGINSIIEMLLMGKERKDQAKLQQAQLDIQKAQLATAQAGGRSGGGEGFSPETTSTRQGRQNVGAYEGFGRTGRSTKSSTFGAPRKTYSNEKKQTYQPALRMREAMGR